ncbi:hypothetical protein [Planomonospora venezuelensis]|uniref:Uncharacterized protein n=1 Tax=Planomonospora venezuelensis TaxID=1999 RepID=A0A841CXW2_PLAVE|nr:hypothetical protein [Planomonospora venezuelensis]MBB5960785.1 hypothetical protein [Planomonospora venezuelensis]GIN03822.1 hypothetical protein Pve01_54800 [Planomonospora venezuelensis]
MRIKLPASIGPARPDQQARSPRRHDHPARDLKPTGRTDLLRRPTAAPRRSGY